MCTPCPLTAFLASTLFTTPAGNPVAQPAMAGTRGKQYVGRNNGGKRGWPCGTRVGDRARQQWLLPTEAAGNQPTTQTLLLLLHPQEPDAVHAWLQQLGCSSQGLLQHCCRSPAVHGGCEEPPTAAGATEQHPIRGLPCTSQQWQDAWHLPDAAMVPQWSLGLRAQAPPNCWARYYAARGMLPTSPAGRMATRWPRPGLQQHEHEQQLQLSRSPHAAKNAVN